MIILSLLSGGKDGAGFMICALMKLFHKVVGEEPNSAVMSVDYATAWFVEQSPIDSPHPNFYRSICWRMRLMHAARSITVGGNEATTLFLHLFINTRCQTKGSGFRWLIWGTRRVVNYVWRPKGRRLFCRVPRVPNGWLSKGLYRAVCKCLTCLTPEHRVLSTISQEWF